MADANKCCVKDFVDDDCHTKRFRAEAKIFKLDSLEKEDLELLYCRISGLKNVKNGGICDYHYKRYISMYTHCEKKCCDPWNEHSKVIDKDLKVVDLIFANKVKKACDIDMIPGKKMCRNCKSRLLGIIKNYEDSLKCCIDPFKRHRQKVESSLVCLKPESKDFLLKVFKIDISLDKKICNVCSDSLDSEIFKHKQLLENQSECVLEIKVNTNSSSENTPTENVSTPGFQSDSQKKRKIDDVLSVFDMPPFKHQKLSGDRIVTKGVEIVQNIVNQFSGMFESALEVQLPQFGNLKQMSDESSWFKSMIGNVKEKYESPSTKFDEKVSLLTLLPQDWRYKQVKKHLCCSRYMFNEAKKLRENIGILGQRKRKSYLKYSLEIRKEIEDFYLDDENSSECSGAKEKITVNISGTRQTFQKRLMLYDQKDLYNSWKAKTKQILIPCLAFFCQLQPKHCFFAGEPGTHNICVCCEHQNIKLKTAVINPKITYKQAINATVCSIDNKCCMLRECRQCPSENDIYEFLRNGIDVDAEENRRYTIWDTVSMSNKNSESSSFKRMSLVEYDEPFKDILKSTSQDLYNFTEHHFISSKQKEYYSRCQKELDLDTALLVMDFAENYSFIAQNSAQGLYFNNVQATLFTAVLYYKDISNNDITCKSFCVVSDTKTHQAYSVHAFQEAILNEIKKEFPWIEKLIYYSDGAPTQFKNKNHLINICFHENDFGIKVISYNFFVTSHGKSAADGIGAAAKRITRKAAIQGQCILNATQMYNYLSQTNSDITYLYVSDKEVESRGKKLKSRFDSANTIKNTRRYHSFEPIDLKTMRAKLYTLDTESEIVTVA